LQGLKSEQGAEPPGPLTLTTAFSANFRQGGWSPVCWLPARRANERFLNDNALYTFTFTFKPQNSYNRPYHGIGKHSVKTLKFPDLDRDPDLQQHLIFCYYSDTSVTLKTISLEFTVNFSLNCPYPEIIKIPLKSLWLRVIILITNKV